MTDPSHPCHGTLLNLPSAESSHIWEVKDMDTGFRGEFISFNNVAKQWHVHISTVYRWAKLGVRGRQLPSVLVGGRRFVRVSDLEIFLASSPPDKPVSDDQRNHAAQQQLASFGVIAKRDRSRKA